MQVGSFVGFFYLVFFKESTRDRYIEIEKHTNDVVGPRPGNVKFYLRSIQKAQKLGPETCLVVRSKQERESTYLSNSTKRNEVLTSLVF